ncbi:MAG: flagellar basal body-associated FliL family protein [Caenibius sp.]
MIQLNLAASTRRDGRVLQWLKLHEIAVRSAILVELAATPEEDVYTVAGKQRLQQRLTAAINAVLVANEGFGGVDAVHFEAFVVQ